MNGHFATPCAYKHPN